MTINLYSAAEPPFVGEINCFLVVWAGILVPFYPCSCLLLKSLLRKSYFLGIIDLHVPFSSIFIAENVSKASVS